MKFHALVRNFTPGYETSRAGAMHTFREAEEETDASSVARRVREEIVKDAAQSIHFCQHS
jgi:hypothetical protein